MEASGVSLVSRRHLEKILSEQGFAYNIVVNERARLGRLAGADILLVVSITKNRITQSRESVSAYGMTENIVRSHSDVGYHSQSPRSRERAYRRAKAVYK